MPPIAKKARMTNDQRHELLRYLITHNAAEYGRGDSHDDIRKAASNELGFTVKRTTVQSNIAFLQTISALPFHLRKRGSIKGSQRLISRSWDKLDLFIRTVMSGKVLAECWTLRTAQRYAKAQCHVRVGLQPLATALIARGYTIPNDDPDAVIVIVHGAPK